MSETLFVQIRNHSPIRRDLLRNALDATSLLKNFNDIIEIRNEKEEIKSRLMGSLIKMKKLTTSLEEKLPKIEKEKPKNFIPQKITNKSESVPKEKKEKLSENDVLALELKEIERKLNSI